MNPLDDSEIHIWHIHLDAPPNEESLSQEERTRAARFHFDRDRTRYINAHAALRDILSRYTSTAPQDLSFQFNPYGKPSLTPPSDLTFNLSHSRDHALLAVAQGIPIGIDIEYIRQDINILQIAHRFFSPREISVLTNTAPSAQPAKFFDLWTRKESFLKAIGMGVSFPLSHCDVSDARVRFDTPHLEIESNWYVRTIPIAADFAAALATTQPMPVTRHLRWDPDK